MSSVMRNTRSVTLAVARGSLEPRMPTSCGISRILVGTPTLSVVIVVMGAPRPVRPVLTNGSVTSSVRSPRAYSRSTFRLLSTS